MSRGRRPTPDPCVGRRGSVAVGLATGGEETSEVAAAPRAPNLGFGGRRREEGRAAGGTKEHRPSPVPTEPRVVVAPTTLDLRFPQRQEEEGG
jgi:hypothetical protein